MFRRKDDDEMNNDSNSQAPLFSGESATVLPAQSQNAQGATSYPSAQPANAAQPQAQGASSASSQQQAANSTLSNGGNAYQMNARPVANEASRPQPLSAPAPFRPATPNPVEANRARPAEPRATAPVSFPSTGAGERKETRRVLTVGSDILLKGEIATCDRLLIEGKVDAVLNDVGTVELAESGSFKGIAHVENAEISGLFEGELVASGRLVIYASGRVRGKITYGEIEIERGGGLTGEIKTISSAGAQSRAAKKEDKAAA